jgi:RNA polymerase sigma factor (sigma-70 family)
MNVEVEGRVDHRELAWFLREANRSVRAHLAKRGLRNVELDDCAQEVFVRIIERWAKLRTFSQPARDAYLGAVCHGTAIDWLRRARRSDRLFVRADAEHEPDPRRSRCADREYLGLRVRSTVLSCLADCEPGATTTFALVCLAGHTEAEAASAQGIPRGTVASRLRRIRARLRDELFRK